MVRIRQRLTELGHFFHLLTELHMEDTKSYANFMRITLDLLKELVETLTPYVEKHTSRDRSQSAPYVKKL